MAHSINIFEQRIPVSSKLPASRYFALTASTLRQRGYALWRSTPWAFALFVLTLPIALLLPHLSLVYSPFFLVVVVNVLALTRLSVAWLRQTVAGSQADDADWRLRKPEWKVVALLALLVVIGTGLMYATARVPILIYFSLGGNADSVFFVSLFLALAAIWAPVLYVVSTFAPSLARVAVSGQYDFWRTRQARRVRAWPMMSMLFLLAAFLVITGALLSRAVSEMSAAAIALGVLGILLCIGLVMMATTMSAVAYREQAPGVAGAGD
nr:hypothetical protein [uncultured Achromobacter sp.]